MRKIHTEGHQIGRAGWLRAAVLGANDGIISTASLILGVVSASGGRHEALVAGVAGLVAGAMSMAAGEFVSVSSQADTEHAALAQERAELATQPELEVNELTEIYVSRGLEADLAREVALQLMRHDSLGAHARDELGITETSSANPIQAAIASAIMFSSGAGAPLLIAATAPIPVIMPAIGASALLLLALLGAIGAWAGGAPALKPTLRVAFWGALAMAATTLIGRIFGATV